MPQTCKTPALEAGASRNHSDGRSHPLTTRADWRAQWIVARCRLAPAMARHVARLHFGESGHD